MWVVRRLEVEHGSSLVLPSPVLDLAVLASAIDVSLRPLRGKQLRTDTYQAKLVKLGASGAKLDTDCPLLMFDAVQVTMPPKTAMLDALDGRVLTITERAGWRTAIVRFGGRDWDVRARLELLSCAGRGYARLRPEGLLSPHGESATVGHSGS